jgi:uncharacterized protein (TIGR02246 family)
MRCRASTIAWTVLFGLLAATMLPPRAHADTQAETVVKAVLSKYQAALNASSTAQVIPLYAEDGIFMWEFNPSVIGKENLRRAYDNVFKTISLHVKFQVAEVVQMSPEWAFARTNSSGTQTLKANGRTTAEGNQELFIFHKDADGMWRIARYCFGSTNPPP